ncbi:hypothetical protein MVEN_02392300 [Mycena venus]|uniref:Uncharacterized protein n=1 Tax=Mycena venus TaxID=2733690 RepID=A0A8H6X295_9AGAR|nr:hypothetical protein MVEN_02392300 [Mycena venus]
MFRYIPSSLFSLCGTFARPARPFLHKMGIAAILCVDTICTVAIGIGVCFTVMRKPPTSPRVLITPVAIQILTTYVTAAVAQLFLCYLFFVLTKNKIVAGLQLVLILVHLGFSWASAITSLATLNLGGIAFTTTTVGAILCAATDLSISIGLAWKFWAMMANTTRETSTTSRVRRIAILSVSSGAIGASNTLLMMILLLKGSEGFDLFFACQGRVYALTILGNLLVGIPAKEQDKQRPTDQPETNTNLSVVVFRSVAVETTVSKTPLRAQSFPDIPPVPPLPRTPTWLNHRDSLQLHDLGWGPYGKLVPANSGREPAAIENYTFDD